MEKKILNEINKVIEDEKKSYNIDFNFHVYSTSYYYINSINKAIKTNFNLIKDKNITGYIKTVKEDIRESSVRKTKAFYNQEDNCIVILKDKNDNDLTNSLMTIYHEIRHAIQENRLLDDVSNFVVDIEFIAKFNDYKCSVNYSNNAKFHNKFFFEIDANIYSISKTLEYINDNNIKDADMNLIQTRKSRAINYYNSYNFDYYLETAINSIKKKDANKEDVYVHNLSKTNIISIFNTFLDYNFDFKNLDDIINNPKFLNIDEDTKNILLTSNLFLNSVHPNELSSNAKSILEENILIKEKEINERIHLNKMLLDDKLIKHASFKETDLYLNSKSELLNKVYNELKTDNLNLGVSL